MIQSRDLHDRITALKLPDVVKMEEADGHQLCRPQAARTVPEDCLGTARILFLEKADPKAPPAQTGNSCTGRESGPPCAGATGSAPPPKTDSSATGNPQQPSDQQGAVGAAVPVATAKSAVPKSELDVPVPQSAATSDGKFVVRFFPKSSSPHLLHLHASFHVTPRRISHTVFCR